jgi:hypothetical protein
VQLTKTAGSIKSLEQSADPDEGLPFGLKTSVRR